MTREEPTLETLYATLEDSDRPEDVAYGAALRETGSGPSTAVRWAVEVADAIRERRADQDFAKRLRDTIERNRRALDLLSDVPQREISEIASLGARADQLIAQYYDDLSAEEIDALFEEAESSEPVKVRFHPLGVINSFGVSLTTEEIRELRRRAGDGVSLYEWIREAVLNYVRPMCAHCGNTLTSPSFGEVNRQRVCHTGTVPPDRKPWDCYRLITVYGEQLGERKS